MARPILPFSYFLSKVKSIHGDRYDYSQANYKNSTTKIFIICRKHGGFWQLPHAHLAGQGCPLCAKVSRYGITDIPAKGNERAYNKWRGILIRSQDPYYKHLHPTYDSCSVCNEWLRFSNFKKWFENPQNGYYKGYELDKDILVKGNKIYSPDTCCFVPQEINKLLTKRKTQRGGLPIGVSLNKGRGKPLSVSFTKNKVSVHLGVFDTPEEAFQAYKSAKEHFIKELAEKYFQEGKITKKVYDALMKYEVEITD